MQRFPTRQNHDYRMDPNDDPIYDEYTSSGNNVTEEDRHWNFNIGTDFILSHFILFIVSLLEKVIGKNEELESFKLGSPT